MIDSVQKTSDTSWQWAALGIAKNERGVVNIIKGTAKNSIFVMIASYFRADDCIDAEAKVEDTKTERGSSCEIRDRLSTKKPKRAREKWIYRDTFKILIATWVMSLILNTYALPTPVQQQLSNAQILGQGRLSFFLIDVYDIALYTSTKAYDANQNYALKIDYLIHIKGRDIAERTINEIKKQKNNDPEKLAQWKHALLSFFPDVDKGVSLTGFKDKNLHTQFYRNNTWIGAVNDPQFTEYFFAIWLAERTTEPALRKKLLGIP
jgi:hypothetical protein